jgi:small subunit ribosomal protein S16
VATKIRLKRLGKIRTPHYRVVVMDSRTKRDGRPIEEIGQYHPKSDPSEIMIDSERAQYWLSVGAQPTEAVVALLKRTGDWQKFTGDDSIPSGVTPQPVKPNKLDLFNAALAEANEEPTTGATTKSKRTKKSEEAASAEEPAAEDAAQAVPAADADAAPEAEPAE